jgi:hypothetical protein
MTQGEDVNVQLARLQESLNGLRNEVRLTRQADQEAIDKALSSQKELAAKHNELISQMEKKDATYLTVQTQKLRNDFVDSRFSRIENFQAKITGGLMMIAIVGVANFVKLWTG